MEWGQGETPRSGALGEPEGHRRTLFKCRQLGLGPKGQSQRGQEMRSGGNRWLRAGQATGHHKVGGGTQGKAHFIGALRKVLRKAHWLLFVPFLIGQTAWRGWA